MLFAQIRIRPGEWEILLDIEMQTDILIPDQIECWLTK